MYVDSAVGQVRELDIRLEDKENCDHQPRQSSGNSLSGF
jgi:hypothetical protein